MARLQDIAARNEIRLRFFDVDVVIRSDTPRFVDLFRQMYRHFRVAPELPVAAPTLACSLVTRSTPPVLLLDDTVVPLHDRALLDGHVYERVLQAVVARVRSHLLLHAGVVAHGEHGIILAADSYHGKTTLVLELVRRGMAFLSDEMAALGRADGRVYPFPRSLRVRPHTLELTGLSHAMAGAPSWLGKFILDIETLRPGSLGQAVSVRHVVILHDPAAVAMAPASQPVVLRVDRVDEALLNAIRQVAGVRTLQVDTSQGVPRLRVWMQQRVAGLAEIERLCREHQVEILTVFKRPDTRPDFLSPARLVPIARSQAVMELLQRFLGGPHSMLLQDDLQGKPARLFIELTAMLEQVQCYQLSVGPLHDMADFVGNLVGVS